MNFTKPPESMCFPGVLAVKNLFFDGKGVLIHPAGVCGLAEGVLYLSAQNNITNAYNAQY